jgi:hypothetical protein
MRTELHQNAKRAEHDSWKRMRKNFYDREKIIPCGHVGEKKRSFRNFESFFCYSPLKENYLKRRQHTDETTSPGFQFLVGILLTPGLLLLSDLNPHVSPERKNLDSKNISLLKNSPPRIFFFGSRTRVFFFRKHFHGNFGAAQLSHENFCKPAFAQYPLIKINKKLKKKN